MTNTENKLETEDEKLDRLDKQVQENQNEIKNLKDTFQYICKNMAKQSDDRKDVFLIRKKILQKILQKKKEAKKLLFAAFVLINIYYFVLPIFTFHIRTGTSKLTNQAHSEPEYNKLRGNALDYGQTLKSGEYLESNNGKFTLKMQEDGNLVIYDLNPTDFDIERHWISSKNGSEFYASPIWSSSKSSPVPIAKLSEYAVKPRFELLFGGNIYKNLNQEYYIQPFVHINIFEGMAYGRIWEANNIPETFIHKANTKERISEERLSLSLEDNGELVLRYGLNVLSKISGNLKDEPSNDNSSKDTNNSNIVVQTMNWLVLMAKNFQ